MNPREPTTVNKLMDLLNESVHTEDDIDIGDIEAVNNNFIVVKRGFLNVHYYYIPISKVEGWDGNVLWLNIREYDTVKKYEQSFEPDPNRYYVKDYPYYTPEYLSTINYNAFMPIIPSRYLIPSKYNEKLKQEKSDIKQCDLCNERFVSEDELSEHVLSKHS